MSFTLNNEILEAANWLGLNAGILLGKVEQKPDRNGNVRTEEEVTRSFFYNLKELGIHIREAKLIDEAKAVHAQNKELADKIAFLEAELAKQNSEKEGKKK